MEGEKCLCERYIDPWMGCLSPAPTWGPVCIQGMCPDQESGVGRRPVPNPLSHTSQGKTALSFT